MMNYEAVILDLDGTTVASREGSLPSQRVIDAVKKAQDKVHVVVATGRPYSYAVPIIEVLGLTGPGVFNGGAELRESSTGEIIRRQIISKADMKELVRLSLPFGYDVYTDAEQYETPLKSPDDITEGASKLFIEAVRTNDAIHLLEELEAVELASAHPTTSWMEGDVVDIHVTHSSATKKHGVERIISLLNTTKARTMAIGDSHNDIPMLEAAGFKVVMGNAPEEVKAVADYVTATLENDGVAEAIEKFIF